MSHFWGGGVWRRHSASVNQFYFCVFTYIPEKPNELHTHNRRQIIGLSPDTGELVRDGFLNNGISMRLSTPTLTSWLCTRVLSFIPFRLL